MCLRGICAVATFDFQCDPAHLKYLNADARPNDAIRKFVMNPAQAIRGVSRMLDVCRSTLSIIWMKACYPGLTIGTNVLIGAGTRIRVMNGCTLTIGNRTVIDRRCSLISQGNISIGPDSYVGEGCTIASAGSISIGRDALISSGVTIRDQDHGTTACIPYRLQGLNVMPIKIGSNVWIGANAVILKGVTIADGAVVGALSVVTKNVSQRCVVVGTPAKFLKALTPYS